MSEEKVINGKVFIVNTVADAKDAKDFEKEKEVESGKEIVEVYFTDEEKQGILAYLANDPSDKYVFYIPDEFKSLPQDKAPIFKFLAFNSDLEEEFYEVLWEAKDRKGNNLKIVNPSDLERACKANKTVREWLLKNVLVGCRNYRVANGKEVLYSQENGKTSNTFMKSLPLILKMSLAFFAFGSKFISEEEQLSLRF